ncbi:MAG: L-serine ammonia-lyase, iron-sulfur-dependent, subunit alpha, partial [Bacilli bacterium]|nr:L-serine ammonia-lyase, iron-sulfur-dependent, subunit alpha [Bacilli bacterium]
TYPQNFMSDILRYCKDNNLSLVDYVKKFEDKDIIDYMDKVYQVMQNAFDRGIRTKGYLPGPIKLKRKAPSMFSHLLKEEEESKSDWKNYELIMFIASFAIAEENASGGEIVTAPTCGSAGVLPGCMAYLEARGNDRKTILDSMLVAGLIGILCKTNGSVSGAEAGCQAEIGVACAMGAALIANAKGFNNEMIVQAAEIALEHSLGLTCDPILGYVQVPCIERCAVFALKAKNAVMLTKLLVDETPTISFDDSVKTMYETGKDLQEGYRETSLKGLASLMKH